jgi:hypothetical protein
MRTRAGAPVTLPKGLQDPWRRKLQDADERSTYAKATLGRCREALRLLNESAVRSLDEGLDETLALHRLGFFLHLGIGLITTDCLESLNRLASLRVAQVDR